MKFIIVFIGLFVFAVSAHARVLSGWFDLDGLPVHTADEIDVQVNTTVAKVAQGYRYTYSITSLPSSLQNIVQFEVALSDSYSVVVGTEASPWPRSQGSYPKQIGAVPTFVYPLSSLTVSWVNFFSSFVPGTTLSGFTFVSSYPPKITIAHIRGDTEEPVFQDEEQELPEFYDQTIYGPGKIIPAVGPVKPVVGASGVASPYNNVMVQQCAGVSCTVQLTASGPQDLYGTAYTYTWSGSFGTVPGINPTLQLPVGTNPVTLTVSDPYGTVLTTATMDVVVVNPNPTTGNGGNQGGGNNQGGNNGNGGGTTGGNGSGDIDHDGIPDEDDDDRDGDGKKNDEDNDPDHAD